MTKQRDDDCLTVGELRRDIQSAKALLAFACHLADEAHQLARELALDRQLAGEITEGDEVDEDG